MMQRYAGTLKSFNSQSGWGFIECPDTFQLYGKDMFVLKTSLPNGRIEKGTAVSFGVTDGKSGPEATDVCRVGEEGHGMYNGKIKSFNVQKGWGIIESAELLPEFGKTDMFVLKTSLPDGTANVGENVRFTIKVGAKGQEAADVRAHRRSTSVPLLGGSILPRRPSQAIVGHGAPGRCIVPIVGHQIHQPATAGVLPQKVLQSQQAGQVKSYNEAKGYGFIVPSSFRFDKDLFLLRTSIQGGTVSKGDQVQFKVTVGSKGQY